MSKVAYRDWFVAVQRLFRVSYRAFCDAWPGNEWLIVARGAFALIVAILPYLVYWGISQAIGKMATPIHRAEALWFVYGTIAVLMIIAWAEIGYEWVDRQFWHRFQQRLEKMFCSKKAEVSIAQQEEPTFRDLVAKVQERGVWPVMNIVDGQFQNLMNLVRLAVALAIVGAYDWTLCLLVGVALLPQFLIDIQHGQTLWHIFDAEVDTRRRYGELRRHIMVKNFLAELKLFQNTSHFVDAIDELLTSFRHSQESAERTKHFRSLIASTLSTALVCLVLVIVATRVVRGNLPLQSFVLLWPSINSLSSNLRGMLQGIARQNEQALHAWDLYQLIDTESESKSWTGRLIPAHSTPKIEFKDVSFAYPWSIEKTALQGISLTLNPGERIGLVGSNGSGKTTLIKLLCGIYRPTAGKILIDGVELGEIDLRQWQRQIAVLFQNFAIHHTVVTKAIALGNTSQTLCRERVERAARSSGAHEFIAKLSSGYDTMLGREFTNGAELSHGQDQRMALARVHYREARLLILDEPTAALDAFAEAEIFRELAARPRESSVILITHRLGTIREAADKIIVLEEGRVREEGSHDELMSKPGLYAKMFLEQARGYGLSNQDH